MEIFGLHPSGTLGAFRHIHGNVRIRKSKASFRGMLEHSKNSSFSKYISIKYIELHFRDIRRNKKGNFRRNDDERTGGTRSHCSVSM